MTEGQADVLDIVGPAIKQLIRSSYTCLRHVDDMHFGL
eukprot:CAMPEP_0117051936 /NCGR_PEP_ID=MMETSP0472-20121206/35893_1 /TAXON_ID=693140 ORGANISM="Tiarina fusus, Strain LIS" /NCGR_SAMPLE_ID=MMETSP0472 /ASSEMBLY_ACC=CAM_ASM_000603 /LENGTH=37 /DNA_ID= /DNA_START= /DNA_END= /DNA_ORIENTATION=